MPTLSEKRKNSTLSVSLPATTNATPISQSRGSPKHKRVGLLSKRRTSSSPFRRVDPPTFMRAPVAGTGLPFSIDAALSGTLSSYTPKQSRSISEQASPLNDVNSLPAIQEAMPKNWFFEIHEDTPEEEAANLMEHSALCLDISSDDDQETKRMNLEKEKGKENVPPPDFFANASTDRASTADAHADSQDAGKLKRRKRFQDPEAMVEDRKALGDLNAADFYPEGLDATSVILATDEVSDEQVAQFKPSGLAYETKVDAEVDPLQPSPVIDQENTPETLETPEVAIWVDESTATENTAVAT